MNLRTITAGAALCVTLAFTQFASAVVITPAGAHAWPNQRTVPGQQPSAAIDGNTSTFTWVTNPYNRAYAYFGLDFGGSATVDRIRFLKDLG